MEIDSREIGKILSFIGIISLPIVIMGFSSIISEICGCFVLDLSWDILFVVIPITLFFIFIGLTMLLEYYMTTGLFVCLNSIIGALLYLFTDLNFSSWLIVSIILIIMGSILSETLSNKIIVIGKHEKYLKVKK